MAPKRRLMIALAVMALIYEATAVCHLTEPMVENEERVFFLNRANGLNLLHTDQVNANTELRMMCDEKKIADVTCLIDGQFSRKIPVGRCKAGIKPEVTEIKDASCPATMYRVGYLTGPQNEFYRACYDAARMRAHFTIHTAHHYTLTTERPDMSFTTDKVITGKEAKSFDTKEIYERFKFLLGARQKYMKNGKDVVLNRGHMAPSADFLLTQGMYSTFKFINVMPQFGSINRGNWAKIEKWVRENLRTSRTSKIVTGGIGVLQLASTTGKMVDIYLATGNRNPVPKYVFKIVVDKNVRIVFVTLNNIHAKRAPPAICNKKNCPIELSRLSDEGYTHCCEVNDFLRKHLPTVNI